MRYDTVRPAIFRARPNRFVAQVELDGAVETVHVKNTGRCRELLVPGCRVYLAKGTNPGRKTAWDLIAVEKVRPDRPPLLINMDAQAPNAAAAEWLPRSGWFPAGAVFRREVTCGGSRFDFAVDAPDGRTWLEVKGVTLEQDGVVRFPDAPTDRGVRHIEELIRCREAGGRAALLFVVQMAEARQLRPNDDTHPQFGEALRRAVRVGVEIRAVCCRVTPSEMTIADSVPVVLE